MGIGATGARLMKAGIAATAATALAGCSMAGLPNFKPLPAQSPPAAVVSVEQRESAPTVLAYARPETAAPQSASRARINALIDKYAAHYNVPAPLVHRVVAKESTYRPNARNGPYWGLMQIRHDTARSMGYRGDAQGLLDAETNLKYAVKYLRGAYIVGGYNQDAAVRLYQRGYYYDARDQGLLDEVGLR